MVDYTILSRQLDMDGFFIWPALHRRELIDEHLDAYLALNIRIGAPAGEDISPLSKERRTEIKQARYAFHDDHPAARELLFSPPLRAFLDRYFGDGAVLRQPETGIFHRNTPPHNDSLDLRVSKPGTEVRVWHALEDVHPDAGPMYVLPGSHRSVSMHMEAEVQSERPELIALLQAQMGETTTTEFYAVTKPLWSYVRQDKFGKAARTIPLRPLLLKKGDAVVFRSDLVHGTCRCNQPGLTRAHAISYWSSRQAEWYQSRAYWGSPHDHRRPENAIPARIRETPHGPEISFQDMHAAYLASFERAVLRMPPSDSSTGSHIQECQQ